MKNGKTISAARGRKPDAAEIAKAEAERIDFLKESMSSAVKIKFPEAEVQWIPSRSDAKTRRLGELGRLVFTLPDDDPEGPIRIQPARAMVWICQRPGSHLELDVPSVRGKLHHKWIEAGQVPGAAPNPEALAGYVKKINPAKIASLILRQLDHRLEERKARKAARTEMTALDERIGATEKAVAEIRKGFDRESLIKTSVYDENIVVKMDIVSCPEGLQLLKKIFQLFEDCR
ncbi:MAG: hypothetical protein BWY99_01658 [Synergistetes bacterium ADurb.BinA166]|nr:MAG: hypothetical protein BWY99_01658 [Synergistetes bacterium ADurb.BinA166]